MIGEIWTNPYIQELGIFDHCSEIQDLKTRWRTAKASDKAIGTHTANIYREALDRECMDLYIILEKWAADKPKLKVERMEKFDEKTRMDIIEILKREG